MVSIKLLNQTEVPAIERLLVLVFMAIFNTLQNNAAIINHSRYEKNIFTFSLHKKITRKAWQTRLPG